LKRPSCRTGLTIDVKSASPFWFATSSRNSTPALTGPTARAPEAARTTARNQPPRCRPAHVAGPDLPRLNGTSVPGDRRYDRFHVGAMLGFSKPGFRIWPTRIGTVIHSTVSACHRILCRPFLRLCFANIRKVVAGRRAPRRLERMWRRLASDVDRLVAQRAAQGLRLRPLMSSFGRDGVCGREEQPPAVLHQHRFKRSGGSLLELKRIRVRR
jgi:hypothetical protein